MTITFEINRIIENKIIVKQISGNSIFENNNLNTEFELLRRVSHQNGNYRNSDLTNCQLSGI
jgi:hypothetical protein